MADFYCDYTNGNDTTGDGSSGNPYKTIEKIAGLGSGVGTSGNRIYVANTSKQVASAGATWSAHWLATDGAANPTLILPWDNGGSITLTLPNGSIIDPAFEWDGNDAVATLATGLIGLIVFGGYLHSTTSFVWNPTTYNYLICCKLADSNAASICDGNIMGVFGCHFVGDATASQDGLGTGGALHCHFNYFDDLTGFGAIMRDQASAVGNVIRNCDEGGFSMNDNFSAFFFNTIIGNSSANSYGLNMSGSAADGWVVMENIIQGFSGTGAKGIRVNGGSPTLSHGNSFWNNTTNTDGGFLYEVESEVEADDPLVNAASGDFSVEVASDAYQSSYLGQLMNRGASQEETATGNGTSVMRVCVSAG